MNKRRITDVSEVIDILGGTEAIMALTRTGRKNVSDMRANKKRFPSKYSKIISDALAKKGYVASPEILGLEC